MASETDQILHAHNPDAQPKQIAEQWRPLYDRLLALRDRLIDAHQNLTADANEARPNALKNEPGEIGTESFQGDFNLAMASSEEDVLGEVRAALERIETNAYGTCEITGQSIPPERLEAVPWTRYSIEGQRHREQNGDAPRMGLGELGTSRL
jgi:RNA polymerase-binding transcription factor DksA